MTKNSLTSQGKNRLIEQMLNRKTGGQPKAAREFEQEQKQPEISSAFTCFDRHPGYEKILIPKVASERLGIRNPFFIVHEGVAGATTQINGQEFINFANYNYLGLAGHPEVNQAAIEAIQRYGTSASASRLVAGERPVQRELEIELAKNYGVDDSLVFVSGHITNTTTIGYLFGPKDLIIHDSLIHNSVLEGIRLSGATRRSFPHNDTQALDQILSELRHQFERTLIVVEGVYSMDGDISDLPTLIEIKKRHQAFLMVDEAHSLGVLGKTGKGLHEHHGIDGKEVDIWMGTLSKTLASCGGFIAGETALIENLKYAAPGFVYSVGLAPNLAAASLAALKIMQREPERVAQLQARSQSFLKQLQKRGYNTGYAIGYAVVPIILGSSLDATHLSNQLFDQQINVQPVIYPAVEEKAARLRFFLSSQHTDEEINNLLNSLEVHR